jgi:hypothetical protein
VHQVLLVEELQKHGAEVVFLDRPMSRDPHDQLLLQIRGAVAEYERTLISERMRRGRLRKLRAGTLLPWTRPPYGYRLDPERPRDPAGVRVDEAEAAVVPLRGRGTAGRCRARCPARCPMPSARSSTRSPSHSLVISIPSAALAVWDIADRIRKRRKAQAAIAPPSGRRPSRKRKLTLLPRTARSIPPRRWVRTHLRSDRAILLAGAPFSRFLIPGGRIEAAEGRCRFCHISSNGPFSLPPRRRPPPR